MATTLLDVARQAGVSIQTASRVANNRGETSAETRARVQQAISELGYRPNGIARGLRARQSKTIGILVPDIANPYFPDIVRGAESAASQAGYAAFLCNVVESTAREAAMLALLEERRVDGVIVCSARQPDEQLFSGLRRHRAAVVVNRTAPPELAGVVRVDYRAAAMAAVRHLAASGRRRLEYVGGPADSQGERERADGFRAALKHAGLPRGRPRHTGPGMDGGREATLALLQERPDTDGLFCYNDLVAAGAIAACRHLGLRVPEDVAVVGCDDISFAALFSPALTTLRVPTFDIGVVAARTLLERMQGVANQPDMVFQARLVVRGSAP